MNYFIHAFTFLWSASINYYYPKYFSGLLTALLCLRQPYWGGRGGGRRDAQITMFQKDYTVAVKWPQNKLLFNTELLGHNAQFYKRFTFLVIVAEYRYVFLSLGMIFNILSTCSSGKVKVHINKEVIFLYKKKKHDYLEREILVHWFQEWLQNCRITKNIMFEVNWTMDSLFPQKTYQRTPLFYYRQISDCHEWKHCFLEVYM